MKESGVIRVRMPLYKKLVIIGIIAAVAVYCIPKLQEKILTSISFAKDEWRKIK